MTYTFATEIVSDLHKEAYGCRPTAEFMDMWNNGLSDDGRQAEWDYLLGVADRRAQLEALEEQADVAEFERELAQIMQVSKKGITKAEALRYMTPIHFEENPDLTWQDIEFWVWERGILFTDIGKWAVEELKKDLAK